MNSLIKLSADGCLTPYDIRKKICRMEYEMFKARDAGTFQESEYTVSHEYAPGVYIRTIFLPKGHLVIGAIHRHEHFNFISVGHVSVLTEQFGMQELRGYWSGLAPAGVKRAIYVHDDTFWSTIHPTMEIDPVVIRKQVTAESYSEIGLDDPMIELRIEK